MTTKNVFIMQPNDVEFTNINWILIFIYFKSSVYIKQKDATLTAYRFWSTDTFHLCFCGDS